MNTLELLRIFVPTNYQKSIDDVRDKLCGTMVILDPDGRISEDEERRINAEFARFRLVCARDDDEGRQFLDAADPELLLVHVDNSKPYP